MRTIPALALAVLLVAPPLHAGDATGAFAPYEDLLEVVADLAWHLRDDTYRFPPPKDPTGHDLYRLVLHRLENWERRFPGKLREVTTFARAETLERLGEYVAAGDAYEKAAALPGSPLAVPAREGATRSRAFAEAAALAERGPDLDTTLALLGRKLDVWKGLVGRHAGTPYEPLARVEEERLERAAARLVVEHRRDVVDGTAAAERALRFLIEKHADSKNLPTHVLRLGDLYADLAREYVEVNERPLTFDEERFVAQADRALETYRKVATWDGVREKPEAQGRFAALEAYKTAVLARHR